MKPLFLIFFGWAFVAAAEHLILRIETRDKILSVHSSETGHLYSLKLRTGELVLDRVDEATLSQHYSELASLIKQAIASKKSILLAE